MHKPIVWTIAGSDSSGGAGIQADLQVFANFNVQSCSVITAITAQNNLAVDSVEYLSSDIIAAQLATLKMTSPPRTIKIGMLGSNASISCLMHFLASYAGKVVLDPVFYSSSGAKLFSEKFDSYFSHFKKLFPYIDLLTPNIPEAEKMTDRSITTPKDVERAANDLLTLGVKSVLIKGGHTTTFNNYSRDFWTDGQSSFWLSSPRFDKNCRGTGCGLSSAITVSLALDYDLKDAIVIAKMYINQGIRLSLQEKLFHGPWPENEIDLPELSYDGNFTHNRFSRIQDNIGLYPIVDSLEWLKKLLPLGLSTVQLRIKEYVSPEEVKNSILLAKKYNTKLFINDYWEFAIQYNAYGVHLGQEDILRADLKKISASGLRLGISTHCYYEVAHAHTYKPSYMACGPIFSTTSKIMPFTPQGLDKLTLWRKTLSSYPLVAIGGINDERLPSVLQTKVDGVAVISVITKAPDPVVATNNLLTCINNYE